MMKLLLDTHIALWALTDPKKLDNSIVEMIEDGENDVFFSVTSVWEIAIKNKIHPEQMPLAEEEFVSLCEKTGFERLDIKISHIFALKGLSRSPKSSPHNDPFDRLLLAQAKTEGLQFLTHDHLIAGYNEPCVMTV